MSSPSSSPTTSDAADAGPATPRPSAALVWTALGVVYVVWGSTYLAIRVVVRSLPPMGAMGLRFVVAGLILAVAVGLGSGWRTLRVTRRELRAGVVIGVLLLVCGNGGVALAEKTVPSGLAALLVAAMPLWLVLLRRLSGDHPRALTLAGTLVGFVGIAVLARPGGHGGQVQAWGIVVILVGTLCWATGTFLSPRLGLPGNPFVGTTVEMLSAGLVMLALSVPLHEWDGFELSAVPAEAWWALAYLVVFGSLLAFTAFVWLVGHAPLSLVSTYAYVNPVVAVLLGWAVLAEPVTAVIAVGGGLAVLGVFLVVAGERPRPARP